MACNTPSVVVVPIVRVVGTFPSLFPWLISFEAFFVDHP